MKRLYVMLAAACCAASVAWAKPVFFTGNWNAAPDSDVLASLGEFLTVRSETKRQTFHGFAPVARTRPDAADGKAAR